MAADTVSQCEIKVGIAKRDTYNDIIGGTDRRIRDLREDNDLTQQQVADHLHIGQNTYSQYETGHRQIPIDVLIALAEFYKTSTDYLLGITNCKKPYPKTNVRQEKDGHK